jgi:hypothetical protein
MDPWEAVNAYAKNNPGVTVEHHLKSFNHFVQVGIQESLKSLQKLEQRRERTPDVDEIARIRLGNVRVVPPKLRPQEAVARDVTYGFKVYVGVALQFLERRTGAPDVLGKVEDVGELLLCTLPAMVRSSVCVLETEPWNDVDLGGYFVVDGHERHLPLAEEYDPSYLRVYQKLKEDKDKEQNKEWTAELHGVTATLREDTATEYHGEIEILLPGKKKAFPLFVVMRAYGLLSDADVVDHILLGKDFDLLAPLLVPSVHASGKIFNCALAAAYIGGVENDDPELVYRIGRMAHRLLLAKSGVNQGTGPSSLEAVRIKTSGEMLHKVFQEQCELWKNKWSAAGFGEVRAFFHAAREIGKAVTEHLSEPLLHNRLVSLRKVRRLAPGSLNTSHFGFYDVVTTDELATMVRVSDALPKDAVQALLELLSVVPLQGATAKEHGRLLRVVVDGKCVGSVSDMNDVVRKLKPFREANLDLNLCLNGMELSLRTTAGRLQRPLWLATSLSVLSFVDAQEVAKAYVALGTDSVESLHTHVEIHGAFLYGQKANRTLVFADHTPISLSHAACSFEATTTGRASYLNTEEAVEELQDTEVPLVRSRYAPATASDGANVAVAIMCYEQNSVTFNKAAIDRGLFRTYRYVVKYSTKTTYMLGDHIGGWEVVQIYWTKAEKQKIRLRKECQVDVGTVFGTRSGIKSVCSAIVAEKDMPFSANGVCPDVIINPLLVESVACILEGLCGKVHCDRGSIGDGTPFQPQEMTSKYINELKKGTKYRDDIMIDGKTGAQVETTVFLMPLYLRREKARDESPCLFGEDEAYTALGHGMTAVVQDAVVARQEQQEMVVDVANGVQAVRNEPLGVLLAPENDGPIEFDGQMKPLTSRRHANRFVSVTLPKDTHKLLAELRTMNVQMRFLTRPSNVWFGMKNEAALAGAFRSLPADAVEVLDNALYVSHTLTGCGDALEQNLFPTIETKDWLLRVLIGALDIAPTADSRRAQHHEDKLHLDVYSNMDWRSAKQTLLYCFRKTNGGVFVRIQNNRVANFFPIRNAGFSNDFSERLSFDGKEAANPQALEALTHERPSKWVAVGSSVEAADADPKLAQLYDMLVNTCSRLQVNDCVVVFNRSDYPYLGADRVEANPALHGVNKKVDSAWKKTTFIPILSPCTTEKHADLAVPTADDWEGITQDYFTTLQAGEKVCKNRYLFGEVTPWANRTASVPKSEDDPGHTLPVFYWRALADGEENHPRTLLNAATKRYAKERKGSVVKVGVLDALTSPSPTLRLAHKADNNLIVVHPAKPDAGSVPKMKIMEQAKKYKFTFNVEGVAASYRLGALFRLGFCVLHVQSPYQLWFERLTDRDGEVLLKGGDVENYQEDWAFLSIQRDLSNLERTIEWCTLHDEKCKRVAENAKRFYNMYFTKQYVYEFMASTLNAVSGRQRATDRTVQEEQAWLKDITTTYDALQKLPKLVRNTYEVTAPMQIKTTVVIVLYRGKDHHTALQQWLKHHHKNNVLVVRQAEGALNRGALLNAAFLYVASNCPEIDTFVFIEPEALFNADFAQRYFGSDGKNVVDFGKALDMPLTWALKVSKEVFQKANGFPNNIAEGGENEAFENRLRISEIPVYTPIAKPMLRSPKKQGDSKVDTRAALVVDALQWQYDGVKTLQYAVTNVKVGDWTLKPTNDNPNIRTLTIRLTPDVQLADLQQKKSEGLETETEKEKEKEKDQNNHEGIRKGENGISKDTGAQTTKENALSFSKQGGAEEPKHLETVELAYVHTDNLEHVGGNKVVNIMDDDLTGGASDKLPFLQNTDTMPTDKLSTVKEIKIDL